MVKHLLVIILSLSTILVDAQTIIFSENFNSGSMPANFTITDLDGLIGSSSLGACGGSFVVCSFNGQTFAASASYFTNGPATANDWMVTPAISLTNNASTKTLQFDASTGNATYSDGVEIYVSTTGNTPTDFLTTTALYNTTATGESTTWTTRNVDISAYSGQTIYIAFRNNTYSGSVLGIDNIKVLELSDNNVELTSLNFPQYTTIPAVIDIDGTITNVGGNTINSMDITWTDGINSYTDNLSGLNIASNTTYNFIHNTQLNLISSGNVTISVTIDNINATIDPDTSNNSLTVTINDVPFIPTKRVVFEESGGTWCPFCPEGIVALESLDLNYPLTAIGIAVHNNDAMMDNTYDNGLNMSTWPSARIDRAILANGTTSVNEQKFIQYYNERINTFSPVEITANANFDASTRNIIINLSGEFVANLSGDYRFNAVILENGVGPYSQQNNFYGWTPPLITPISGINFSTSPSPVSLLFDNVARTILGGFNGVIGSLPSSIIAGATHTYQYTHTLPSNHNENNIQIVGMVIDNNTGEILNGIKVNLELITSAENITETNSLIIYPNPAKDELKIKGEYLMVEIYDVLGKLALSSQAKKSIDISLLNNGIYTANIQTKDALISKKFALVR